jgi:hypothetical protein
MTKRFIILSVLTSVFLVAQINHTVKIRDDKPPVIKTKATMEEKKANKIMAMRYAKAGWNWDRTQRRCAYSLFMKESKFDHLAKNQQGSSAFGIGQVLKETSKDPAIQILNAYKYIKHRYDTPCKAWKHSQRRNWY